LCQSMGALVECLPWSEAEGWLEPQGQLLRAYPLSKPCCVEYCLQSAKQLRLMQKNIGDCCALPVRSPPKLRGTRFLQQAFRSRHVRSARCIGDCKGSATQEWILLARSRGLLPCRACQDTAYCGFCLVTEGTLGQLAKPQYMVSAKSCTLKFGYHGKALSSA
jgi:hypothetical protein